MKIRNRYLTDNLLVGLIPILLIFILFFLLYREQGQKKVRETLENYIWNFKVNHSADVDKFEDYSFFISRTQFDLTRQTDPQNLDFPISIESYGIRLFELYYRGKFVFHDVYSWQDSRYFTSEATGKKIWDQLTAAGNSAYYKVPFPELVSNVLVIRCASVIAERDSTRVGFANVAIPLDSDYFKTIPLQSDEIVYYIRTTNGFVYSKPEIETPELDKAIREKTVDPDLGYTTISLKAQGTYYCYEDNLYTIPQRISNRIVPRSLADVGVLYDFKAFNNEFFLFQRVILFGIGIILIAVFVTSFYSANTITQPILRLKSEVEQFEKKMKIVSKPDRVKDEIQSLRFSVAAMSETIVQNTNELKIERNKLKQQNKTMLDELELARKIQMHYIPGKSPLPSIDFRYIPMTQVGGDYFDFVSFPDGRIGIFISDVSGHGVPAAFITSMIKSFFLENAGKFTEPSAFLLALHDFLMNLAIGYFVTAYYALYDPEKRTFEYSNAGHNSPYRIHNGGIEVMDATNRNIALAIYSRDDLRMFNQDYRSKTVVLDKGDKVLLYTDGLVDAVSLSDKRMDKEAFEDVKMIEVMKKHAKLSPADFNKKLLEALETFRGGKDFDDDVCIVCLEV